jgi:hypothetical protein
VGRVDPQQMELVPLLDVLAGLVLVAAIGLAAGRPAASRRSPPWLGWCLLAWLPLAVALHLLTTWPALLDQVIFAAALVAFAAGAVLVLAAEDGLDDPPDPSGFDPAPWWPEFERDFRTYARRQPRPRVRV